MVKEGYLIEHAGRGPFVTGSGHIIIDLMGVRQAPLGIFRKKKRHWRLGTKMY